MRVLVVLPTNHEIEKVTDTVRRVRDVVSNADVLVVDDGDRDGAADQVEKLGFELGNVDVLRRPPSVTTSAYLAGFRIGLAKGYDAMAEMHADRPRCADLLPGLLAGLGEGAEVAAGEHVRVWSASTLRRLGFAAEKRSLRHQLEAFAVLTRASWRERRRRRRG